MKSESPYSLPNDTPGGTGGRDGVDADRRAPVADRTLDVQAIYRAHGEFVWKSLFRLGVQNADLEDMVQEVFVVVHRRLHTYDGSSKLTTWLFGISMRVAATYRRTAHRRREIVHDAPEPESRVDEATSPDTSLERREAAVQLEAILSSMDLEKRAVFVMFEIEEMPCADIATLMDVPVGTVYSRLHAARKAFADELARRARVRERRGTP